MSKALGKGLGALLDDAAASAVEHGASGASDSVLSVEKLIPSTVQPRHYFDDDALKSLSSSIKSQGVLQPLLVRPVGDKYEIIAGERRWRASKMAGLTEVPVVIRELTDGKALEVAIVENVQRADLNAIDEAEGYLRLTNEFNYTHEEMARVTGKSRSHISNLLRLLALPPKLKDCVSKGLLTMGHARALLGISDNESLQIRLANRIVKNSLSVRETEDLVRKNLDPSKQQKRLPKEVDPVIVELENRVGEVLGCMVSITQRGGAGSIKISFKNQNQLKGLLKKLGV